MKDNLPKLAVGIIVALISALLGWALAQAGKPEVQVLIDRPLLLAAERLTVFRVRNIGGAPASNIEIRFFAGLTTSAIVPITPLPAPPQQAARATLPIPKLRPSEEVSFYIKEAPVLSENPRGLVEKVVYDEGQVSIYTNDDMLNAYIRDKQINAAFFGFIAGFLFFAIIIIVSKMREKKPNQPLEPTASTSAAGQPSRQP